MALFLARTAAADNVRPSGLGNIVTDVDVGDKELDLCRRSAGQGCDRHVRQPVNVLGRRRCLRKAALPVGSCPRATS